MVPSVSCGSFTRRSDVETGLDKQNNSSSGSAYSNALLPVEDGVVDLEERKCVSAPLPVEDGVVDLEEMKCVYAKPDGLSAGVRPPPAVNHTTVQYAGINIRATHVSRIT